MGTNTPNLSRRHLLAAAPAAAIVPSPPGQAPHDDAELIALARALVATCKESRRLIDLACDCEERGDLAGRDAAEDLQRDVVDRKDEIEAALVAIQANTLAGVAAKALAQRSDAQKTSDESAPLDGDLLTWSLVDDILRLSGIAPAAIG